MEAHSIEKKKGKKWNMGRERGGGEGDSYSGIDWVFKNYECKEKGCKRFTKN